MSKRYRLSVLGISLALLIIVGWIINHSLRFIIEDFWFTSGLLLLILLSLVDQPFFSKDSNIFVNSVTALLSLLLIPAKDRTATFWIFLVVTVYLIVCSYLLMWMRTKELYLENKAVQFFARLNRQIGKPEVLFSAFFLWGIGRQFSQNAVGFNGLLLFWIIFMVINIPSVAMTISELFHKDDLNTQILPVGKIFGVQSKNTFLVQLLDNRQQTMKLFDYVEFVYAVDMKEHKGIVLDVYLLDQEQWIKVLTTPEIDGLFDKTIEKYEPDYIYKVENPPATDYLTRFVGLICENAVIEKIKFTYNARVEIYSGNLVELAVNSHRVLYQVVQGITKNEQLANKNESSFVVGEAIQIGEWNHQTGRFERYGWVPNINTPLFLASEIEEPDLKEGEFIVGHIPGTNYPVILNKELAVTHHTAILGVTGSGKSVFARNLIRQIADETTKVIIVDLTGEYEERFPGITSIITEEEAAIISTRIDMLIAENAKFADRRNMGLIQESERIIRESIRNTIERYLKSDANKIVFELNEITNKASSLEYTRWFFGVLFSIAKEYKNYGKRVCVVLEEAHTVIPEINSMGTQDTASRATVNSIAQIALQGRKYNIGFLVIAQRTANVSKTVLTQCNSVVVFQELDRTTSEFLANYMGQDLVEILPTLKERTAIAMGKAFRSSTPMIFQVPDICE